MTRVAAVLPFVNWLETEGFPVDKLLAKAGISSKLLQFPAAALPLEQAFQFGEIACHTIGSADFGLYVGMQTSLEALGPYGRALQCAATVGEYLDKGVGLFNTLTTGQRLEMRRARSGCTISINTIKGSEIGQYQSHLQTLAITIRKCREAAGPDWSPPHVNLARDKPGPVPVRSLFAGSRVTREAGASCITIPREVLAMPLPLHSACRGDAIGKLAERPLPEDLNGLVLMQIEALLSNPGLTIDIVARSLGVSTRSLQRNLAHCGLTFSELLNRIRLGHSTRWLQYSDKSIIEIAMDLGYCDPSNFTRAFKRNTGVSPQAFRGANRRHNSAVQ